MSWKERLKGAVSEFIVTDEPQAQSGSGNAPAPQKAAQAKVGAPPATAVAAPAAAPVIPVVAPGTGVIAPDAALVASFTEELRDAVDGSRLAAYDQFQALMAALAPALPDLNARTAAALNACEVSHKVGAKEVVVALDDRLAILEHQKGEFQRAVDSETETSIGATVREIEKIDAEIARMEEAIRAARENRDARQASVATAQAEIAASKLAFGAAHAAVRAELTQEREKIAARLVTTT